jgi:chemotaxis protein methyltransferase CheR
VTGLDAALERASALLADHIGLRVEGSMRGRVARAVRDGAAARGESPAAYVQSLLRRPDALQALVDAITVQETRFFRDPAHFEVLVRRALPRLPPAGVVWSVGCAHGQEAWSLAMALEEAGAEDWYVLATDVSRAALTRAQAGHYSDREVESLSPGQRARFMRRREEGWEIGPRLRRRVHVRAHNLAEDPPPAEAGTCHVVFCRNVLIYLDRATTRHVIDALHARMPPDGWLFLGSSEALTLADKRFVAERLDGTYVYRPRSRRAVHRPPPAPPAPAPAARRPGRRPAPAPLPDPGQLLAEGKALAAAGRHAAAAASYRKAAYLAPDDPRPLLGLGLALEQLGQPGATRAFRAARAVLARADDRRIAAGWSSAELARLLDAKLGAHR